MGKEKVNFWLMPSLKNLELLHATYVEQTFSRHIHNGFAIGVIEQGALRFSYRGEMLTAPTGSINLVIPGEAHDGFAASKAGWTYRMFYLKPQLMENAVFEMTGKIHRLPYFSAGVIYDRYLAYFIRNLHFLLEKAALSPLEQESLLLIMLTKFISRYQEEKLTMKPVGQEKQAVLLVKQYIEENYQENFSLQDLAELVHLSPFYLLRVFRQSLGIPPHIYLKQVRIEHAKEWLAKGFSVAFAAQETGFSDQSHLSKQFKQITGVTPKKYSNIIQEI